jgi:hypothetical protein
MPALRPEEHMPYIHGRYYMNPVVGDALEAAREAEAALQALEHAAKVARGETGEEDDASGAISGGSGGNAGGDSRASGSSNAGGNANAAPGPIHRVEIEAAELVPSHTGRAQRGFVARIHRHASNAGSAQSSSSANGNANSSATPFARNYPPQGAMQPGTMRPAPETHVFSNHSDLTNFLRDQFANDCAK